jgi:hypothetical protein
VSEIATTEEAAAAVAASLMGQPGQDPVAVVEEPAVVVEAEAPVVSEQPAAAPAPAPAPVARNLNPELPDDLAAELAEAEIDEEVESAVAAYVYEPATDEYGNAIEIDEDAVREAVKLRKRNEFLERELVKQKSGSWRKEIEQYFPLAKHALDDIMKNATSRRSALREAKKEHERILPHLQAYLAEAKAVVDEETATATDDARAVVADSWGKPLVDPSTALSAPAVQQEARVQAAREKVRSGAPLRTIFSEMLRNA